MKAVRRMAMPDSLQQKSRKLKPGVASCDAAFQSTKFTVVVCPVLTVAVLVWVVNPV